MCLIQNIFAQKDKIIPISKIIIIIIIIIIIRNSEKPSTPKAQEGYCNEATQSGQLAHSQSHQALNTVEYTEVKHTSRRAWTKEEIKEVIWCYMYCRQHFTKNRFNTETNDISTMNSNNRIAATLYSLGT